MSGLLSLAIAQIPNKKLNKKKKNSLRLIDLCLWYKEGSKAHGSSVWALTRLGERSLLAGPGAVWTAMLSAQFAPVMAADTALYGHMIVYMRCSSRHHGRVFSVASAVSLRLNVRLACIQIDIL